MYAKIRICKIISLSLLLNGCANSMYFYETEKISLTVEARPDSSQPVQGNLGVKQRVVLIVPKKSNGDATENKNKSDASENKIDDASDGGEALSAISSFNFKITDGGMFQFNPILIQTAFITGDAAATLYNDDDPTKVAAAAKAITYRTQAESNIETRKQRLGKILAYVTDGSGPINSAKLDDLISKASKINPLALTPPIMDEIKKSKTRSELNDTLFFDLGTTVSPIYEALPTDKQ